MKDIVAVYWIVVLAITSQIPRIYANHLRRQMTSSGSQRVLVIPLSSIVVPNSRTSTRRGHVNTANTASRINAHNSLTRLLSRGGRLHQNAPSVISLPRLRNLVHRVQRPSPRLPAGITMNDITRQLLLNQIIDDIRRNRPKPTNPSAVPRNSPPVNLEPKTNIQVTPSPKPMTTRKPIIIEANSRIKEIRTGNGQTQVIMDSSFKKGNQNKSGPPLKPGEDPPEPETFNLLESIGRKMGLIS